MPEQYGGAGVDRRYSVVLMEKQGRAGLSGPGWSLHSDIVANYINGFGTHEQKLQWLQPMARGKLITPIAMTEPRTGSELQAARNYQPADSDILLNHGTKLGSDTGQERVWQNG